MSNENTNVFLERYRKFLVTSFFEQLKLDYSAFSIESRFKNNSFLVVLKKSLLILENNEHLTLSQLKSLICEILYTWENDVVIKGNASRILALIAINKLKNLKKQKDNINIEFLKSILHSIYKELSREINGGYNNYCYSILYELNNFINAKFIRDDYLKEENYIQSLTKLEKIVFIFIDILKNYFNYSRKYLDYIRKNNLDSNNIKVGNDEEFWKYFKKITNLLRLQPIEYEYYFKISIKKQANRKKYSPLQIKSAWESIFFGKDFYIRDITKKWLEKKLLIGTDNKIISERKKEFLNNYKSFYIGIKEEGIDIHSTFEKVYNKFKQGLSILLSEFNALELEVNSYVVVFSKDKSFILKTDNLEYLNRRSGNIKFVEKITKLLNNNDIKQDLKNALMDSINYYYLFLRSKNVELRFFNIWSALEALFSNVKRNNQTTFDIIYNNISQILILTYVFNILDLTREFILQRVEKEKEYSQEKRKQFNQYTFIFNKILGINDNKFNVVGIFKFFKNQEFSKLPDRNLKYFKTKSPYYYLQFLKLEKLFSLSEKSNGIAYWDLYQFLFDTLSKQINFRLNDAYLVRNFIVHKGYKGDNILDIIVSLEYFYLIALNELVSKFSLDDKISPILSLEEYIERTSRSYEFYNEGLNPQKNKKDILLRDEDIVFYKFLL